MFLFETMPLKCRISARIKTSAYTVFILLVLSSERNGLLENFIFPERWKGILMPSSQSAKIK